MGQSVSSPVQAPSLSSLSPYLLPPTSSLPCTKPDRDGQLYTPFFLSCPPSIFFPSSSLLFFSSFSYPSHNLLISQLPPKPSASFLIVIPQQSRLIAIASASLVFSFEIPPFQRYPSQKSQLIPTCSRQRAQCYCPTSIQPNSICNSYFYTT